MRKNNEENSKTQELETLHNIILDNLNEMLTINQWSIKKLADTADLPYESVKKLLAGKIKNPTVYTLYKICTALGCGIDQLMETGIEGIAVSGAIINAEDPVEETRRFIREINKHKPDPCRDDSEI